MRRSINGNLGKQCQPQRNSKSWQIFIVVPLMNCYQMKRRRIELTINPVLFGVLSTISVELLVFVVAAFVMYMRKK